MDVLAPNRPNSLVRECLRRKVLPQAYSPLGGGGGTVLGNAMLKAIGAAHKKSTAQVAIRWLLQAGIPAITACSATQQSYMKEDLGVFDWKLTAVEMKTLGTASFANETTNKKMCMSDE